ncbi:MAG TPA: hypothetical protein VHL09_12855 [Dehalococcoidia bacterium]|nr:hypothetical protein [Dehalococcoidia bacterium]
MDQGPLGALRDLTPPASLDWPRLIQDIRGLGAASAPVLREETRQRLLAEAARYPFLADPETVGSGDRLVRQQMGSFASFPPDSGFLRLRDTLQSLLDDGFATLDRYPFGTPLAFTDLVLQRYPAGSLGITPHRDGLRYANLICIVVLGGSGRFFVCRDRAGNDPLEIDATPGRVILLRAPGLLNSPGVPPVEGDCRPFHYVTSITETRYTFGLRQTLG